MDHTILVMLLSQIYCVFYISLQVANHLIAMTLTCYSSLSRAYNQTLWYSLQKQLNYYQTSSQGNLVIGLHRLSIHDSSMCSLLHRFQCAYESSLRAFYHLLNLSILTHSLLHV